MLAVRVDHSRFADSRWYTGSGIYRHVRLCLRDPLHVAHWGTFVTTPKVTADSASVRVETLIENRSGGRRAFVLESDVLRDGRVVGATSTSGELAPASDATEVQETVIPKPARWSPESPALYVVRQRLRADGVVVDEVETTFGIRSIRFDPDRGFFLNDQPVKLKGVCLHHDAGSLGAAVPEAVWERRLRTLKEIGVNAIRTSHNPPAPELLDLCDRLGLLVKDEAFDEFTPPKNKWVSGWNEGVPSRFGYGEEFSRWSVTDIQDLVRRDRNHPSVIMWSVGNEIDYPNDPFSHPVLEKRYRPENPPAENLVVHARPLVDAVRKLDSTRPVTAALASLLMSDAVGLPELFDIVGYNYQESRYADDHARHPRRVIFGSENGHQFGNWTIVRDNAWVAGQFLWTGIDYLGEARAFPNRANGAGLLDLAGFKKPVAWFRQSLWSDRPMVYLAATSVGSTGVSRVGGAAVGGRGAGGVGAGTGGVATSASSVAGTSGAAAGVRRGPLGEHWNWPVGSTIRVTGYSNCEEVQLSLNGTPLGSRRSADARDGALSWEVPFAPGVLKAVGLMKGKQVAEFSLRTAEAASRIELRLVHTGEDIRQVEFVIVDPNGVRVPGADRVVTFSIDGPARVLGVGNGDLNDIESGLDLVHRTYLGRGLVVLQTTDRSTGTVLRASAPGLQPAALIMPASRAVSAPYTSVGPSASRLPAAPAIESSRLGGYR